MAGAAVDVVKNKMSETSTERGVEGTPVLNNVEKTSSEGARSGRLFLIIAMFGNGWRLDPLKVEDQPNVFSEV